MYFPLYLYNTVTEGETPVPPILTPLLPNGEVLDKFAGEELNTFIKLYNLCDSLSLDARLNIIFIQGAIPLYTHDTIYSIII